MSADVKKTRMKQEKIKDLVAHLANFYTRIIFNSGCIFHLILIGWYSIHFDINC